MKTTDLKFLKTYSACSDAVKWSRQYKNLNDAWQVCERGDWMMWLLRKLNCLTKEQAVILAVGFAERVLPIFEKRYPNDTRPREAITAARKWLENPNEENAAAAYAAADDAERKAQSDIIRFIIPNIQIP